jgi:hypothetical protein
VHDAFCDVPVARVGRHDLDADRRTATAVGLDRAGAHPSRAYRFEVVGERQRDDHERDRRSSQAPPFPVDRATPGHGVAGDHESIDLEVHGATERGLKGDDPPLSMGEVPPDPSYQGRASSAERLDTAPERLRVVGDEPVRRDPDRDLLSDLERRRQERLVADVKVVERPAEDRETEPSQGLVPPSGDSCSRRR